MGDKVSPNGYSYTAIDIHYSKRGELTFSQMCTNDGPIFENDLNYNKIGGYKEAFQLFQKNYLLKYIAERDIEDALFSRRPSEGTRNGEHPEDKRINVKYGEM